MSDPRRARVGEAGHRLLELRDRWLNPPGLAPADLPETEILEHLLTLNLVRAREPAPDHPPRGLTGSALGAGYSGSASVEEGAP